MKLKIADNLSLPLDLITQTTAILGNKGSGKTNTGVVCVEELLSHGAQIVVIDPLDSWWGLKASADGKAAGYPVFVLGGHHADLPLRAADGAAVADFIVDNPAASAVICLRHFESQADQRRFVTDFALRLFHRKGEPGKSTPALVVMDEAALFVPQRVMGETAKCVGAIQKLVRQGRSSGIGVMLIDQRAASVNKDVLTQLELLVAHRHTSPQDRAALEAWVEAHDTEDRQGEFMESLAALKQGAAWFWSPSWLDIFQRVQVRKRKTFDSSATPKAGDKLIVPQKLAEVDLGKLKERFAATVEAAKASDPAELRRKIAELEKQLKARPAATAERIEVPVVTEAQVKRVEDIVSRLEREGQERIKAADVLRQSGEQLVQTGRQFAAALRQGKAPPPARAAPVISRPAQDPRIPRTPAGRTSDPTIGNSGKRRLMIALAQYPDGLTDTKLSLLTGISKSGGTWRTYMGELRGAGWIEGNRSCLKTTPSGVTALGDYEPLPTGDALIEYWRGKLGNSGKRAMFDAAVAAYPNSLSYEEMADRTGIQPSGGTWRTYLGELRGLELLTGKGEVRASADLF